MKPSKVENLFHYQPSLEDSKTLSPLTYYQPFQSSFDPGFSVPPPKTTTRQNPPQMVGICDQGTEGPGGSLQMSGAGVFGFWNQDNRRFCPQPFSYVKSSFPETLTSSWRETKARGLCNTTWRGRGPLRSPFLASEESQSSKYLMAGVGGSGMPLHFPQKSDTNTSCGNLNKPLLPRGSSFVRSTGQTMNFDASQSHSTYYPLMLGPLRKNMNQNVNKTGHCRPMVCNFCKNNKEVPDIYLNHYLYDPETKVLSCPVLRKHVCEICGGTGDQAHTLQYCPVNRERGLQSKVPVLLKTRTITNSTGKIRRN